MDIFKRFNLDDFNYNLPAELIAKYPLADRGAARLIIFKNKELKEDIFNHIDHYLNNNQILVLNNTKVIPARIIFQKETGAYIEIFCEHPYDPADYYSIFQTKEKCIWKCLIGNIRKWKTNFIQKIIKIDNKEIKFEARKLQKIDNYWLIEFRWNDSNYTFHDIIENAGKIPIPPYIKRDTEEVDKIYYQTIYSKYEGSVASPTAGLHFTDKIIEKILNKGLNIAELTLHVGSGTFKPIKSDNLLEHEMHEETFIITDDLIRKLLKEKEIVAVGTTTVRCLESLPFVAEHLINKKNKSQIKITQWEPYQNQNKLSRKETLDIILKYMEENNITKLQANTQLFIIPGFQFTFTDALVTNFHQPKSTLLLLVSAFIDGEWKRIYNYALENRFRFLSYGDGMLLFST